MHKTYKKSENADFSSLKNLTKDTRRKRKKKKFAKVKKQTKFCESIKLLARDCI